MKESKKQHDGLLAAKMPTELVEQVRRAADREMISMSAYMRRAIARDLERRQQQPTKTTGK